MGDRRKVRLSAIENIQEKFKHNIQEMEEQLARLTSLFEDMAIHPRGPSPLPNQWVPQPFTQTISHLPRKTNRPNLWRPTPTAPPTFMTTSRPADQPSDSRNKHCRQKIDKDKPRWDPIPITYTELFPKLVEIGHIEPVQLVPLRPSFSKWYNAHTRCDYHFGNPGHSIENCTAFKRKVRDLINEGKLKFKKSDGLVKVEDSSRTRANMTRQKTKTLKEASIGKAAIPKKKVPIAKLKK